MKTFTRHSRRLLIAAVALSLAACASYVKRDEFDSAIADLRRSDDNLQQQINTLSAELRDGLARHDAAIEELRGRVRVDMAVHFDFDDATLRAQDQPALDDFARVIRDRFPNALVTVEGFADPAGPSGYNQRLGLRRAQAVADYLVGTGGLAAAKVRSVSYGEARNRLVLPDAWGPQGEANRRVVLVVDHAGT